MPEVFDARTKYPQRFRRLLSFVARASQPSCLRLPHFANALHPTVKLVQPFIDQDVRLLWPRLTSAETSLLLSKQLACTIMSPKHPHRSLRVRRVTFLPYIRHIYADLLRMTLGFESHCPLAQQAVASYAVRVPRTGSLPAASFRFRVAPDTLAVRLGVPVIKASIGTCTRRVTSWFAFASQLRASVSDAPRHA